MKLNRLLGLGAIFVFLSVVGCNGGDDRLAEKARLEAREQAKAELQAQLEAKDQLVARAKAEGQAQAEAALEIENANLAKKASSMEADLKLRHRFFQALKGSFEGELLGSLGGSQYKVRINLVPNLAPFEVNRVRLLEEIASDLNNLYFNVQILQWDSGTAQGISTGCRVDGVRPDLKKGEINVTSPNCPNLYQLKLVDDRVLDQLGLSHSVGLSSEQLEKVSYSTAEQVIQGEIEKLAELRGEVHPSTNPNIFTLKVKRMNVR